MDDFRLIRSFIYARMLIKNIIAVILSLPNLVMSVRLQVIDRGIHVALDTITQMGPILFLLLLFEGDFLCGKDRYRLYIMRE